MDYGQSDHPSTESEPVKTEVGMHGEEGGVGKGEKGVGKGGEGRIMNEHLVHQMSDLPEFPELLWDILITL